MGANGAAARPHRQFEIKPSGARGATRQHSVNTANAAFMGCQKFLIRSDSSLKNEIVFSLLKSQLCQQSELCLPWIKYYCLTPLFSKWRPTRGPQQIGGKIQENAK